MHNEATLCLVSAKGISKHKLQPSMASLHNALWDAQDCWGQPHMASGQPSRDDAAAAGVPKVATGRKLGSHAEQTSVAGASLLDGCHQADATAGQAHSASSLQSGTSPACVHGDSECKAGASAAGRTSPVQSFSWPGQIHGSNTVCCCDARQVPQPQFQGHCGSFRAAATAHHGWGCCLEPLAGRFYRSRLC